jgi:hypothetical protein
MSDKYARGSRALGICDVCGFREKLSRLRPLIVRRTITNTLACPKCWVPDQPQLLVGEKRVIDPQALRNPRPNQNEESRVVVGGGIAGVTITPSGPETVGGP